MKYIFTSLVLVLILNSGFGQFPGAGGNGQPAPKVIPGTYEATSKGSGKIIGFVIDSAQTKAVEFATIGLFNKETGKPVDGATADDKGKFTINRIPKGNYKVIISFIGYKSYTNSDIVFEEKGGTIDLGIIKLAQSTTELKEVVVQGQRAFIEDKVDRLVYNAEKDATNNGGDATDVLKKVPMLSVDLDGNVSMKGNSNVRVLINNKPSSIMATSVADALKQIPADMIKSVEVITAPSAKYDAEGSSGIINIITKKNNLQGLTLNLDTSVGVRGSNAMMGGNYKKGKFGMSLNGFGRWNYNINGAFENNQKTTNSLNEQVTNIQSAETRNAGNFGSYRIGMDYDLNKYNSLTASFRVGQRNQTNFQDLLISRNIVNNIEGRSNTRNVNTIDNSGSFDINLDYTHTYEKPQKEFSILTQFNRNNRQNDFVNSILNQGSTSEVLNRIKNQNESTNQEITIQFDFQNPVSKSQQIEMGAKTIIRNVTSDFNFFTASGANGAYIPASSADLRNVFNYDQNVLASYFSLTSKWNKKMSSKVGVRYEFTDINANFAEGVDPQIPSYDILVPSITISRNLKGGKTLKASYNKRIQRPSLQFLNPNINSSNPLSISQGNPLLDPEFTDNLEVSLNTFFTNTFLTISAFARSTNNAIETIRDVTSINGNNVIRSNFANIGSQKAYGINAFGNYSYKAKFQLGIGGDFYYVDLKNNVPNPIYAASNTGFVGNFRAFGGYNLKKGWGFQLFSFYRANQVNLQGSTGGFGIYSLSLKKDFVNKKGSIGFGAENFFTPEFNIRSKIESPVISQTSVNTLRNMNFKINFSYKIGKMTFDAPSRKKTVNNDDVKEGGGDNNGGGGMQGGGGNRGPR